MLRLSEDGEATPQSQVDNDIEESSRRSVMQKTQFKCVIRLNNKAITETKECTLSHSTLTVDFRQYFEFRVLHQPDSLFVDIYAMTPGFSSILPLKTSVLVASIEVPIPGGTLARKAVNSSCSSCPKSLTCSPLVRLAKFLSPPAPSSATSSVRCPQCRRHSVCGGVRPRERRACLQQRRLHPLRRRG